MNGTIHFETWADLAEFLKAFCPSSATFIVRADSRGIKLTFDGGF